MLLLFDLSVYLSGINQVRPQNLWGLQQYVFAEQMALMQQLQSIVPLRQILTIKEDAKNTSLMCNDYSNQNK